MVACTPSVHVMYADCGSAMRVSSTAAVCMCSVRSMAAAWWECCWLLLVWCGVVWCGGAVAVGCVGVCGDSTNNSRHCLAYYRAHTTYTAYGPPLLCSTARSIVGLSCLSLPASPPPGRKCEMFQRECSVGRMALLTPFSHSALHRS